MPFEKHKKHSARGSQTPFISLRQTESIGINAAAMEEYFSDHNAAILYYDEENNQIGIEPADDDDEDAYKLMVRNNSPSASLNAASFLTAYGLVPDETTRYEATWNEDAELVTADLDDPASTYGTADE